MLYICLNKKENNMKTYSIKNYQGQKCLIVNDLSKADVLTLYKESVKLSIPFGVKQEIGVQFWGLAVVANYLGVKDSSTICN